jgi:hypothetical protein
LTIVDHAKMMDLDVMFNSINLQEINATRRLHLIPRFVTNHANWLPHRQLPGSARVFTWKGFWWVISCVDDRMMVLDLGRWHAPPSVRLDRTTNVSIPFAETELAHLQACATVITFPYYHEPPYLHEEFLIRKPRSSCNGGARYCSITREFRP